MAKARIKDQHIIVETKFTEKDIIRKVPGRKYESRLKAWKIPLSYNACVYLASAFGKDRLKVTDQLKEYAGKEYQLNKKFINEKNTIRSKEEIEPVKGGTLLPLQDAGVRFMTDNNAILADDTGAGKTVQIAEVMRQDWERSEDKLPALIVCPKSVRRHWAKEISKWTDRTPTIIEGGAVTRRKKILKAIEDNDVLILNWDLLKEHSSLKGYGNTTRSDKEKTDKELNTTTFSHIIADEAHRMKSPKSKWTRAIWQLKGLRSYALTGTPIANDPGELWPLLHFVHPEQWPGKGQFEERYCNIEYDYWGGKSTHGLSPMYKEEFYQLIDPYFIRRTLSEIMDRSIRTNNQARYVQLPPKHRKMYKQMKEELITKLDDDEYVSATNPLVATSRLVQLCGAPLEMVEEGKFKMVNPSPKVNELMNVIEDLGKEKTIVFSSSKQLLHLAKESIDKHNEKTKNPAEHISYSFVTGDVTGEQRDRQIHEFQEEDRKQIFLATVQCVGEGVDLTAAKYMVFLQRSWSMVENLQGEGRNKRVSQLADEVTIIDIVTEDTIDERIHDVFGSKKMKLDEITRDSLKDIL